LDFEELRPAEPYSNPLDGKWEADAKKWEATSRDWETLARITHLQTKVAIAIMSLDGPNCSLHCHECGMDYGVSKKCLCKCRLLVMVHEAFRGEWESFGGHFDDPLPKPVMPTVRTRSPINFDDYDI